MKHKQHSSSEQVATSQKRVNVFFSSQADYDVVADVARRHGMKVPRYLRSLALGVTVKDTRDAHLTNQLANVATLLERALRDPDNATQRVETALKRIQDMLAANVRLAIETSDELATD